MKAQLPIFKLLKIKCTNSEIEINFVKARETFFIVHSVELCISNLMIWLISSVHFRLLLGK